jgi:sec-independent protein translocase protein TatA
MFGSLGVTELAIIGIIALIIFGPRQLPRLSRAVGETIAEWRKVKREFSDVGEDVRRHGADVARTVERTVREPLEDRRG